MRVLVFYQYFGTPSGSWSTRMYEFCKRWVNEGHKVTVVTSPYYKSDITANGLIDTQNIDGIELKVINFPDSNKYSFLKRAVNAALFSLLSTWIALTAKYDVILCSSGPITIGLPGLAARYLRGKKFIFEIRDLWPKGAIDMKIMTNPVLIKTALALESRLYKAASTVISCSPGMDQHIQSVHPGKRTHVAYNSSDTQFFESVHEGISLPEELTGCTLYMYVGSMGVMDDCIHMLKAMKHLSHESNIHLLMIGDGAQREMLEEFKRQNSLDNVTFLGLIPKYEVIKWLKHAHATLVTFSHVPAFQTNSPNKMFDSFAAGVPIIQNTTGWISDLVKEEKCGLNASPEDGVSIANAMFEMANDKELRNSMAESAKRLALTRFDRDIVAARYLDEILEVSTSS